jgi:hypothetical protein
MASVNELPVLRPPSRCSMKSYWIAAAVFFCSRVAWLENERAFRANFNRK